MFEGGGTNAIDEAASDRKAKGNMTLDALRPREEEGPAVERARTPPGGAGTNRFQMKTLGCYLSVST